MKPFTIWTRPVLARISLNVVPHIDFNVDIIDSAIGDRWVASFGNANAIQMRPYGALDIRVYIPNGRGDLPPLPSFN